MSADYGQSARRDRWLILAAAACVLLAAAGLALPAAGIAPGAAALFLLVPVGIGFRVLLTWAARQSSPARRAKVLGVVTWAGLAVSAVAALAMLPSITQAAGFGTFLADLLGHAWPIGVLTLVTGGVRTLPWRTFAGAGLTGFLGLTALSRLAGEPVIALLGRDNPLAIAVWVPLTEEIIKALPVLVLALLAARRRDHRPSAADLVLLAAWTGAGFALYEDALFGRGALDPADGFPLSLLVPGAGVHHVWGVSMMAAGHLVYTGLAGLGIAVGVLYRRRHRLAWLALPVALAIAAGEHAAVNGLYVLDPAVMRAARLPFLGGWLASIVLVGGTLALVAYEWLRVNRSARGWFFSEPAELARRSASLATLQKGRTP
ncbi:PrsW family glutamic-type intramembrane protease [Longispora albida]|uniref:PrsW family glutamic-type intramembrane protease n=1 Tax=Longispora albida TaxID=203523 RepID=UPI00036FDAAE|nr:PrsW family glutamic-type intramembrane protease [Longispora albida]